MDPADILPDKNALGKNRSKEKQYAFDYAFDKDTSQVDVFLQTTKFLCDGVLNGYNATVFAYGATGAGKTYT
jgi:kinesin family protein 18/19